MTVRRISTVTDGQTPSIQIVEELASSAGMSVLDVEPLQNTIDSEALDTLLEKGQEDVEVTFRHAGYEVTATPDEIQIQSLRENQTKP